MSRGPFLYLGFVIMLLILPSTASFAAGRADPASIRAGMSGLPVQAQAAISAALGRDRRAYQAERADRSWHIDNPRHGLQASFSARGVVLRKRSARVGLRLAGLGRGARLAALAAATPEGQANRIAYRRGRLTEWYVNGPLGLEQGFTLDAPPAQDGGEALTVALRLSSDLSARPDPRGDGIALQAFRGATVLRYRGLAAWDSTGRTLPAWWQAEGTAVRLRVDDAGARYPLTIDPIFEDARLTASDGVPGDTFGFSVAVSGDTVVVGALGDDVDGKSDQGSAYVFVRPVSGWAGMLQENAKLVVSNGDAADDFGISVAASGDTVAVGAIGSDVGNAIAQGAAYVFVRPSAGWSGLLTENARLTATDGKAVDFLGDSVAVDGDTVVVRSFADDVGQNPDQGSAYVFVKPAGGWAGTLTENAKLVVSDGAASDFLITAIGRSAAVSGDTVVIGAAGDDTGSNTDQGSAYVYVKPAAGWAGMLTESAKLTASDGTAESRFGFSVAASGDTVVIGTLANPVRPAYVFVEPPGGWAGALQENARLTSSDGVTGFFAAASGDTVVVSPNVYVKPAGGWAGSLTENGRITRSDGQLPIFGPVDIDGPIVVTGLCGERNQEAACVVEGLETDSFEAEPAVARTDCNSAGCKIPITCKLAQTCTNRIRLLARARDVRIPDDGRAKGPALLRLASAIASIPPGETRTIKLTLTRLGKDVVKEKAKRRLKGIIEIRNAAGTAIDRTPVRIRLR